MKVPNKMENAQKKTDPEKVKNVKINAVANYKQVPQARKFLLNKEGILPSVRGHNCSLYFSPEIY